MQVTVCKLTGEIAQLRYTKPLVKDRNHLLRHFIGGTIYQNPETTEFRLITFGSCMPV